MAELSGGTELSGGSESSLVRGAVVHWNLAGWAMHRGDARVASVLADSVLEVSPLPLAVTVNEVCSAQYEVLAEALEPHGFTAAAAWSIPDFGEPRCASFGNAVFWRGGDGGVDRFTYPDGMQVDGAATREKRNLIRATSATSSFRVATTHLAPVAAVAAQQVSAAADWLATSSEGPPTVLAGDLNLGPWRSALDVLYRDYREADAWPRRLARPTHRSLRKLDYVFVPRGLMRFGSLISISFRCRLSDHARTGVVVEMLPSR